MGQGDEGGLLKSEYYTHISVFMRQRWIFKILRIEYNKHIYMSTHAEYIFSCSVFKLAERSYHQLRSSIL